MLQLLKGYLSLFRPMETFLCGKVDQRCDNGGVAFDETPVEASKSQPWSSEELAIGLWLPPWKKLFSPLRARRRGQGIPLESVQNNT